MDTKSADQEIVAIIDAFADRLPQKQLEDMRELVVAGERGIALENLCTQIYEYDLKVPKEVLCRIESVGGWMGLESRRWKILQGR